MISSVVLSATLATMGQFGFLHHKSTVYASAQAPAAPSKFLPAAQGPLVPSKILPAAPAPSKVMPAPQAPIAPTKILPAAPAPPRRLAGPSTGPVLGRRPAPRG